MIHYDTVVEHSARWCQTLINCNVFFVVVVVWQLPQTQREFSGWTETKLTGSDSCYVHNSNYINVSFESYCKILLTVLLYLCFFQCVVTEVVYLLSVWTPCQYSFTADISRLKCPSSAKKWALFPTRYHGTSAVMTIGASPQKYLLLLKIKRS